MRGMLHLAHFDQTVADLLADQLEQVAVVFERQLASDLSAINGLCVHIERYRGKMLRPTLVLLTGLAGTDEPYEGHSLNERHRVVAAVAEMIHMATLVHDDVLDEADVRRQGATVNHLWGNETAVMLGDYLISNAFHLCSSLADPAVNLALGQVTNTLCEGELVQLHHRNDYGIDEATYFEIVRRKTASLIGECCRQGALLSGASPEHAESLYRYGIALGIAFQIQDDLLDLIGDEDIVGKSLGRDLEKGKLTLPVTHHMTHCEPAERGESLRLLRSRNAVALRARLHESGSVTYARDTARRYVESARSELDSWPDSRAIQMLRRMADSVIDRAY